MRLPVSARPLRRLLREIESSGRRDHVLAVGGASELAPVLRQQFLRGRAKPEAVRLGDPNGADAYVHVLAGEPGDEDVAALRRARRAGVSVIAVAVGVAEDTAIPDVLATDVVWVGAGQAFPLGTIAQAIATRLGEGGAPLAAHIPLLREQVCEELVSSFARKNGLLAAAVWIPGADMPALTLNQLRLVLRLAQVYSEDGGLVRGPLLAAALGAAFGWRSLTRELAGRFPIAPWALNGAVAYAGTRAFGEWALRCFVLSATQRRAAIARAAP
jgi:uncharacterized protein (DUF697 family)